MARSLVNLSAGLGLAAAMVILPPAQAAGRAPRLLSSTPAKDSHVPWPKQIILKFDKPVSQTGLQVKMIKPDGSQIPLEAPITSDKNRQVLAEVKTPTLPGPYMVMWQALSPSGAAVKGDYTFFVQ